MRPVPFNIFINILDDRTVSCCTLSKFADGTMLGQAVDVPCSCAAVQRDLEKCVSRNLMSSTTGQAKSSTWRKISTCTSKGWQLTSCKAAFRERCWGFGRQQVEHEPAMCSCSKESQHPGLHWMRSYNHVVEGCKEMKPGLFSVVYSDRKRLNGPKLKYRKLNLNIRKILFYYESD